MKGIKVLGFAAFAALALTVCTGVASAAAPGYFVAGGYPASVKSVNSAGENQLYTVYGATPCGTTAPALGSLNNPIDTLAGTSSKFCNGNMFVDLSMNGCEFILHPPTEGTKGTVDIGGAKCTGITGYQIGGGLMTFPPQNGLATTFENEGTGTGAKVHVSVAATGLKYVISGGPAEYNGSYSNGTYKTNWTLSAEKSGTATGLSVHAAPGLSIKGGWFESELYPVKFGGTTGGSMEGIEVSKSEAVTGAGIVKCPTTYISPTAIAGTGKELELSPTFSNCTITGIPATVTPEAGCVYRFSISTGLTMCGAEAVAGTCKITISPQTLAGLGLANKGTGPNAYVEASTTWKGLSGLKYQVAGSGCPKEKAPGSYSDGVYKDIVKLSVAKVG